MRDNIANDRAQLLGEAFPPLADADVRSLRMPMLLVTGARSPPVFLRLADRLHELVPHARRIEIPGAAHLVHEQAAAAFDEVLRAFLASA